MNETNIVRPNVENLSPVVQEGINMGMKLGQAAKERNALQELRNSLPGRELDEVQSTNSYNRAIQHTGRRKLGFAGRVAIGVGLSAAVLGGTDAGRDVASSTFEKASATVTGAADRMDNWMNGPENVSENESGLPENPNDMVAKIIPEQTT
jgi:hypothetical protein